MCGAYSTFILLAFVSVWKLRIDASSRSDRKLRAKSSRFQPDFADVNFKNAAECIKELNFDGPTSVAWDDTDLEKARSIWQETKDAWLVIGGANGSIRVQSEEEIDAIFEQAGLENADKVRQDIHDQNWVASSLT